jgi:hypothetical protein
VTGLISTFIPKSTPPASKTVDEVRELAMQLIHAFGERSTSYANYQALKARVRGDRLHMKAWRWIAGATVELLRADLDELSRHH